MTKTLLAAALAIAFVATPVRGQLTGLTKPEYKCASGTGEAFAKFITLSDCLKATGRRTGRAEANEQ